MEKTTDEKVFKYIDKARSIYDRLEIDHIIPYITSDEDELKFLLLIAQMIQAEESK